MSKIEIVGTCSNLWDSWSFKGLLDPLKFQGHFFCQKQFKTTSSAAFIQENKTKQKI